MGVATNLFPNTVKNHEERNKQSTVIANWILNDCITPPNHNSNITINTGNIEIPVQLLAEPELAQTVCSAINASLKHRSLPPITEQRLNSLNDTTSLIVAAISKV